MASLQELKNRLSGPSIKTDDKNDIDKPVYTNKPISNFKSKESPNSSFTLLEIEEARYLLALIARSEFSGKDVQIVYDSALKLQEIIKSNLE